VPSDWRAFARQRRRWARGMIEGLRDHGFGLLKQMNLYSHSVAGNSPSNIADSWLSTSS